MKQCLDCSEEITSESIRCRECYLKYQSKKANHCIDCGRQLRKRKAIRCYTCYLKYLSERSSQKIERYCIDCGTQVSKYLTKNRCRSCAQKERYSRFGEREKQSKLSKKVANRPEVKEKIIRALKERYQRPGEREKTSKASKKVWNRPGMREKHIRSLDRYWSQSEVRKKRSEEMKKIMADSQLREQISQSMKNFCSQPKIKEKRSMISKEIANRPEVKKIARRTALTGIARKGNESPQWKGGLSFNPYSSEFNKKLKELIRFRDSYKCQKCGCPEIENGRKLSVHHIDGDKSNSSPTNLISLCIGCNTQVEINRPHWQHIFHRKIQKLMTTHPLQLHLRVAKSHIKGGLSSPS